MSASRQLEFSDGGKPPDPSASLGAYPFMYDNRLTNGSKSSMAEESTETMPLAALGALGKTDQDPDLPLAYVPRVPVGGSFRELIERAVGWSRR